MTFSIIIPLYNKAPYIAKTLESVLAQTFKDVELIIIDDGASTDTNVKIIQRFNNVYSMLIDVEPD